MANRPNTKRNDEIVRLHDLDPIKYSFRNLGNKYKNLKTGAPLHHSTIHEIYTREKAKKGEKSVRSSAVAKGRHSPKKRL